MFCSVCIRLSLVFKQKCPFMVMIIFIQFLSTVGDSIY